MKSEKVTVSALAYGGDGVCRLSDGRVCFVPGALPQEELMIRVTEEKKRFTRGEVTEVVTPSKHRLEPACPYFGKCPGCVYLHLDYAEEIYWKDRQLRDFLVRGKIADESAILPPIPSSQELHYRNKLTLHADPVSGEYGYFGADNTTVFPVKECLLAENGINELIPAASGENAIFRFTRKDGAKVIDPAEPGVLTEEVPGSGEFEVAGNGFFQVNLFVAPELIKLAAAEIVGDELLELYCGVGVFSISLAEKFPDLKCTGIELNRKAISFAKINAAKHQVADRCRFYAGDAGRELKKFRKKRDFTLLIDPPRSGVEKGTLRKIIELGAEKVLYISCAADTLTRDLKEFLSAGYRVKSSRVLDMFPRTAHFESFTVLEKQ